ncbi:MAG: hypothetical protein DWQ44_02495 [Bacteroidetes bacterium]|nr:MAG: hypothetical protein DWQ44_02495 [Bacteroidota bacterium]
MTTLNKNWITENHIDFEYKKYVLLAYLQKVSENFTDHRLYPYLSDLVGHYRSLKALREGKHNLFSQFPETMVRTDMEKFHVIYEKLIQDDGLMQELENILEFSIPQMEIYLNEGKKIYDFLEDKLKIFPVGLIPLNKEEGYMLLRTGNSTDTLVYNYAITIFENPTEKYRAIHVSYIASYEKSICVTYEAIKSDLIQYNKILPNPATYVIESDLDIPFDETFLPMAKRSLVKWIAGTA